MDQALTVTQLNQIIKDLIEGQPLLSHVCVRGELSNYKIYPSGHHYFTLKDSESSLRCVMFKSSASKLRFRPESGMSVTVWGRVSVYPRDGAYQLYCTQLMPEGTGDLQVAFEQLKAKLQAEGLFEESHKKPLPPFPGRIAIITSSAGAAVHDMIRILSRRWPMTKVLLLPVRVQGGEAPPEIAGAIRYANEFEVADLIITGRGGGSIEDLWAFNDERVARAIYDSRIPVISAVGHEPDVTISDFVADLRAATPSNGAELAVPDGIGVVKAAKMAGTPLKERLAGIDICTDTLKICAQKGISVFFLGGKPGVAERAANSMEQQIPSLKVVGTADGYFLPEEEERLVRRIAESGAGFAVVGLGSPKQELFMHKNAAHLGVKACMGVGGSLDVWAGEVKRAPEKFTRAGLEWLYRLVQQPSRIKRIVKIPAYLFLVKFTKKS